MRNQREESWLVLKAQTGDRQALDALLRIVQEPLFGYVRALVRDRVLAEDVLQEAFIRIYRKLTWLRDPELFRPWAFRIASRLAFQMLQRERRRPDQPGEAEAVAAEPPQEHELVSLLPELVELVSPASRAVLVLHYLQEMPLEDVALVLELPSGTVKSRLAYGLTQLRRLARERGLISERCNLGKSH